MATTLITQDIWKEITGAAKRNKRKSQVAVAYFGNGGSKMLPLKSGSTLVVDASDRVVKSGLTDPKELLELYNKGVQVYSYPHLHAKTFVIGSKLFIGSVNVSHNSAEQLQEAVMLVTDNKSVQSAKIFVESLRSVELGKESLKRLSKIYNPPKFTSSRKRKKLKSTKGIINHQIRIVNLVTLRDYPKGHEVSLESGSKAAKKKGRARHKIDEFHWYGAAPFKIGEQLITVLKDGNSKSVSPPSVVIHKEVWRKGKGKKSTFVFIETLDKKSKSIARVKKVLSPKERISIDRGGYKSSELSSKLISLWRD